MRWLVVMLLLMSASANEDWYCGSRYHRMCLGKGKHIACLYTHPGPGPLCSNYTLVRFGKDMQGFIINYINRRRQRIAAGNERVRGGEKIPQPQIMMFVEWDRELAMLAQRLADQCEFIHDDCRATVRYPFAGQTVGEVRWRVAGEAARGSERVVRRVLDAWWGERRRVRTKDLTTPFTMQTKGAIWGHFSQLAVWGLRGVGCGAVRHGMDYPRMLLVCDFSHTNMLGQKTLEIGPLEPCPTGFTRHLRSFPSLCAPMPRPKPLQEESPYTSNDDDWNTRHQFHDTDYYDNSMVPLITTQMARIHNNFMEGDEDQPDTSSKQSVFKTQQQPPRPEPALFYDERYNKVMSPKMHSPTSATTTEADNPFQNWRPRSSVTKHLYINRSTTQATTMLAIQRFVPVEQKPVHPWVMTSKEVNREIIQEAKLNRQRWKRPQNRPQRPGANALLEHRTVKSHSPSPIVRTSMISMTLDKDDVDQLFLDTGFDLRWRKKPFARNT